MEENKQNEVSLPSEDIYETLEKGSIDNPYTLEEYEQLSDSGLWTGGYVEGVGEMDDESMRAEGANLYYGREGEEDSVTLGDCWWRCVAYICTSGSDYSHEKGMFFAQMYWGDSFDADSYQMAGTFSSLRANVKFYKEQGYGGCGMYILRFRTDILMPNGMYAWHAVCFSMATNTITNGGTIHYFDPQKNCHGEYTLMNTGDYQILKW